MKYNVGDIVRISKKSDRYGIVHWSPKDMDGKIVRISSSGAIRVEWENGVWNGYHEEHLKLRKRG